MGSENGHCAVGRLRESFVGPFGKLLSNRIICRAEVPLINRLLHFSTFNAPHQSDERRFTPAFAVRTRQQLLPFRQIPTGSRLNEVFIQ